MANDVGLFNRKKDAEGLYTGDAPVSAPGVDGAAPTAYVRSAADGTSSPDYLDDHAAHAPGRSADMSADMPAAQEFAGRMQTGLPSNVQIQGRMSIGGTGAFPGTRPAARRSPASCLLVLVVVLAIVGVAVYAIVRVGGSVIDSVRGATGLGQAPAATPPAATAPSATALGTPVTVRLDGATFEVTVFGATAQPGDAWWYTSAGDRQTLTVDAQLRRTDAGTDPVRVLGWNWSVADAAGKSVTGDIITNFKPDLAGPELAGRQSARGFLSFDTAVTAGTLTLATGPRGRPLATWTIHAGIPRVVAGTLGTPARGQIAQPGFTVTVGNPRQAAAGAKGVRARPKSGTYLLLDLAVTADRNGSAPGARVERESLVFVPAGGAPLQSVFGAVQDALSMLTTEPGTTDKAVLAFDTAATAGELRLVDGAGHTVITWQVATG